MKFNRTKNATRNAFYGILLKLYGIIIPFIMRTVFIHFMGEQYLGLSSLFTSVLQVLNLAELGVGSAMVYSMYKPIAEDNTKKICALMKMYRTYYRIIGLVIAVAGLILTPFVPSLIKGDIPGELNIYVLYLLELSVTVLSYWLFAYRNCLFYAYQRSDINSKINIISNTVMYLIQLFVLIFVRNYYVYIIVSLLATVTKNIATGLLSIKRFPQYEPQGELSKSEKKDINKRIRDLFTSKIGSVVIGSADSIVISAFLGLKVLARYQNYSFIMNSIMGILTILYASCTAGIGNSLVVETREKNFNDLKKITFIFGWISTFCAVSFLCLYQPFMTLWMGEERLLPYSIVICLAAYFFIAEINQLLNLFKDAGGLWSKDKFRPLVTSLANLGMNLAMVRFWGLYGVILSTVLSMLFIGMPWLFYNLFTELFDKEDLLPLLKEIISFVFVLTISAFATYGLCELTNADGVIGILIRMVICVIVPNTILFICFRRTKEYEQALLLVNKVTKGKLSFLVKDTNVGRKVIN
ncbi:lipopolysaccharide biosynthesis protein [Butyrivibrio sp. AC2005]|uniref:lipopolysaccharide biosynthesis protein n=1 Tax=Butyrivibrio sp. AC2005 TaxID=1280672 RepID=UPI00040B335C|nr:oligosaccharide flippase family protein [Butyrivibrio sp. AC2005]